LPEPAVSFTVQELYRADQTVGVSENTKRLIDLENVWKDFRTKGKRPKNPAPFYSFNHSDFMAVL
jgi:hypothetical protein